MYYEAIQQFARTLKNLDAILEKATRHAEARKFDVNNFVTARLTPDMLPFTAQIRICCDVAKGAAAAFSGKDAPKHEDNEQTMAELRGRIRKCLDYIEGFRPEDFAKTQAKTVVKIAFPQGKAMHAQDMLWSRAIPNFFFHASMAYALLRAGGVEIGKGDWLGQIPVFDA